MWYLSVIIASVFHLAVSSDKLRSFIVDIEDLAKEMAETTVLNINLKENLHQINETNTALQMQVDKMNETHFTEIQNLNQTIFNLKHQLTGNDLVIYYQHLLSA